MVVGPHEGPIMSKEEIAASIHQMMQQDAETVVKAIADSCRLIARACNEELDGTSEQFWGEVAQKIDEVHKYMEEH